jgi:hypothetical protein
MKQVDKLTDPAKADKPVLSRGQLEMIEEDPTKIEVVARLMGAVNLDNLFRFMQGPDINPMARLEFQKLLNKMGKLEPEKEDQNAGGGPQVVINITRAKDAEDAVTIEGEAHDVG